MQSHRNQSHSPTARSHGCSRSLSGSNANGLDYNHDHATGRRRHDNDRCQNGNGTSTTSRPSLASSSRWEPPTNKSRGDVHERESAAMWSRRSNPVSNSNASRGSGNNSRAGSGGPSQGGGKVAQRRRHSSSGARNQRSQYHPPQQKSRPPSLSKKNIVTPKQPAAGSMQPSPDKRPVAALPKLDPADPVHARRMQTRRRQVLFGKNTAGYEEYTKKVPKHKRRPRSMDCPTTPDHTADIPAKRWQGLMNAWRRALHTFDPPDLHLRKPAQDKITLAPRPCVTPGDVAQEEIAQAKASGLQVAFGGMNVGREAGLFSVSVAGDEGAATATVGGVLTSADVPFEEEAAYQYAEATEGGMAGAEEQPMDGRFLESDSDSDDDVL